MKTLSLYLKQIDSTSTMSWKSLHWLHKDIISFEKNQAFNNLFKNAVRTNIKMTENIQLADNLLYFNPVDSDLDPDGYFSYQSPSSLISTLQRYRLRRWTNGEITNNKPLVPGKEYSCHERIKFIKPIGDSCFVSLQRTIRDSNDVTAITEDRTLQYTNRIGDRFSALEEMAQETKQYEAVAGINISDLDIVKYCQMTNNPHRIHWDRDYCRTQEGIKDILVPGPLITQIMARLLCPNSASLITRIKYKTVSPIYPFTPLRAIKVSPTALWLADESKLYAKMEIKESHRDIMPDQHLEA